MLLVFFIEKNHNFVEIKFNNMKTKNFFSRSKPSKIFMILLMATAIIFAACKKDKNNDDDDNGTPDPTPQTSANFQIQDAQYVNANMPAASGDATNQPAIQNISGNATTILGGTNNISIDFNDPQGDAAMLLVGGSNTTGYYSKSITSKSIDDIIMFVLSLDQEFNGDALTIIIAIQDAEGNVSGHYEFSTQSHVVGTGKLQVSLSWNTINDVDLHLIEPDSNIIYYGNPISYSGGLLDLDANVGCNPDDPQAENIFYADSLEVIPAGDYTVLVDLFSDCDGQAIPTNYTVSVRYNGELIASSIGNNPYEGVFQDNDPNSTHTVIKFNIPAASKGEKVYFWNYNNMDEKTAERIRKMKNKIPLD